MVLSDSQILAVAEAAFVQEQLEREKKDNFAPQKEQVDARYNLAYTGGFVSGYHSTHNKIALRPEDIMAMKEYAMKAQMRSGMSEYESTCFSEHFTIGYMQGVEYYVKTECEPSKAHE